MKNNMQKLRSLSLLVPNILVVCLSLMWVWKDYYKQKPALVMIIVGIEFFLISAKFIVAMMCNVN